MSVVLPVLQWLIVAALAVSVVAFLSSFHVNVVPADDQVWLRCEDCRRRWRSHGVGRVSRVGLLLRRAVRRRARGSRREAPEWAAARGTQRCPSCLSRNVRVSRQQA